MDRSRLDFYDSLRIEFRIEVRQRMARVAVVSRRHKNSGKWHVAMRGDLDHQNG